MQGRRFNCWEYQECGHGPGETADVCAAAEARHLDGVNGGRNGGRACWCVPDTLCEGCDHESVEVKFAAACSKCMVYGRVEIEEGLDFDPVLTEKQRSLGNASNNSVHLNGAIADAGDA